MFYSHIRLSLVGWAAVLMVGDQQKPDLLCLIDEAPGLTSPGKSRSRSERERQNPVLAMTIHRFREVLEPLHQHNVHPVRSVESHVSEKHLPVLVWSPIYEVRMGLWVHMHEIIFLGSALDPHCSFIVVDVDG